MSYYYHDQVNNLRYDSPTHARDNNVAGICSCYNIHNLTLLLAVVDAKLIQP